jgi:hypothetical protein
MRGATLNCDDSALNSIRGASKAQPKYPDEGEDLILHANMGEDSAKAWMPSSTNAPNFRGK